MMTELEVKDVIRLGKRRGLNCVTLDELRMRTCVNQDSFLKFALGELMCHALDKEDATEIGIDLQVEEEFYRSAGRAPPIGALGIKRILFHFQKACRSSVREINNSLAASYLEEILL